MLKSRPASLYGLIIGLAVGIAGCSSSMGERTSELQAIMARPTEFPNYPQSDNTYLTFSQHHGFQVNYLAANGRSWLWYPGNDGAVPELWRVDQAQDRVCWKHPSNSYNPVTGQHGGQESCENLTLSRKLVIAKLRGDPYNLASGHTPATLDKCTAPKEFRFDREKYRCK
ncbi:hypothetical protein [Paracoccus alkanivorans]|uniref:hypothetical protein n=1 Tax=Paracoccus alkanivorans TaxID=2116655 RepID=UPI0011C441B6|nr:hypothetical protein [Paracoccus alkanivorans]